MSLKLFKNLFKNSKRNQIKKLFAQMEELKQDNENLAHELTMLKSAKDGNEYTPSDIEDINSRLDDLEQHNIEELADDVDSLKSQIDDIEYDNLSCDLQEKMDKIDDLEDNNGDMDEVKDRLDDLEYKDDKREDDINDIKSRLNDLEDRADELENEPKNGVLISNEELAKKLEELKQVKQDLKNIFVKVAEIFND